MGDPDQLARLVHAVRASRKYRHIADSLIRSIGQRELSNRRSLKEAVKATRNKLHQVAGVYLQSDINYPQALADLRRAAGDADAFRAASLDLLRRHASTRERLPILDEFYSTVFAGIGPLRSILDIGCGLNPLALPWMNLGADVAYYACDIYQDLIAFLNGYFALIGGGGRAAVLDVTQSVPDTQADLALVLKMIPCLEQLDKQAGRRLLDNLRAGVIVVSYPVRSLGGRGKGMRENYDAHFHALIAGRGWGVTRFEFPSELAFVVRKG